MFKDPVFISVYLLVFGIIWVLLCAFLATQTGWNTFSKAHPFQQPSQPLALMNFTSMQFNSMGSYGYGTLLSIHKEGFGVRPLLLFKAFHNPFFVNWNDITQLKEEKEFIWYPALDVYIGTTKLRFYGKAMRALIQSTQTHKV